jgi:hypothetical protein
VRISDINLFRDGQKHDAIYRALTAYMTDGGACGSDRAS